MFEFILDEWKQDPDPVFKFWFAWYGSGQKWTGSATLNVYDQTYWTKYWTGMLLNYNIPGGTYRQLPRYSTSTYGTTYPAVVNPKLRYLPT